MAGVVDGKQGGDDDRHRFRKFLLDLAEDIVATDLDKLKGLMKDKPGYGMRVLGEITSVWEFFDRLEGAGDLSPSNTDYLETLLSGIDRRDLCTKVDEFKGTSSSGHVPLSPQEKLRLNFRKFLRELADNIVQTDLVKLKGLTKGRQGYGKAILEDIKTVDQFFLRLETSGDLSSSKTDYLKELLDIIHRKDLYTKVDGFIQTHLTDIQTLDSQDGGEAAEDLTKGRRDDVSDSSSQHVMISYQWDYQPVVLRIRDELRARGYKLWIDVDCMAGSKADAMADGVEKSSVVLMCMSKKYQESQDCQSEAEYAYDKKKPIIPLRMEKEYKPSGWLGILAGTKIYCNFSSESDFEKGFQTLLKELEMKGVVGQTSG